MGTPLPALAIKQPESPLSQVGQIMQLKNLAGAGKLQEAQIAEQQIQLQQQQMALEDQKKIRQAFIDSNGDLGQTIEKASKLGVNPQKLIELKNSQIDQQTKLQTLQKDELANTKAKNDAIGGAAQAILSVAPELRPQAYALKMKELVSQGIIPPQAAQQPYDEDTVKLHAAAAMSAKDQIDIELKKRETAAAELKAQTEAKKLQAEMPGGALQDVGKAEMNDWLAKNPGKGPSDYAKWRASLAPQATVNVQTGAGPSSDLAQAVANGSMKIGDVLTYRTPLPQRQKFLQQVLAINPAFKSYDFDVEKGVSKDFTSGASAKNLTAFNTAIEHAKQLHTAAEALNVGDMRTMNKIGNALGYEFGSDKTTNFNVIKNALSGEISKVFKGGQATDAEIKAVQEPFDAANSPAQLKGAIRNAISLMNSKRDALKKQYEAGTKGKPNFGEETQGGMIRARDTNGQLHEAPAGTKLPPGWKLEQ